MGYKIVRDRHKERLQDQISGTWRASPDPISALIKKLGEEYGELNEDRDPSELYDLQDVLNELIFLMDPDGKHHTEHYVKIQRLGLFTTHLEWHPNPTLTWQELE